MGSEPLADELEIDQEWEVVGAEPGPELATGDLEGVGVE
jgi:hypothetical protein